MPNRRPFRLAPSVERVEPRLAPGGGTGAPQELLNAVQQSGHADVFRIMELVHGLAMEQRASAREQRVVARDHQIADMQASAEKMRQAAQFALAAGIVSGSAAIAGGAIHAGAGARELMRKELLTQQKQSEVHEEALADLKHRMDTMIRQIQETLSKLHDAQKLVLANITRA